MSNSHSLYIHLFRSTVMQSKQHTYSAARNHTPVLTTPPSGAETRIVHDKKKVLWKNSASASEIQRNSARDCVSNLAHSEEHTVLHILNTDTASRHVTE